MFIIAGIGLNSFTEDKLRRIILAGADILRYNFSYRTTEQNIQHIRIAQDVIDDLNASIKILLDFPLNKIRLGDFDMKQFAVRENEEFIFRSAAYSQDCNQFIPINTVDLGKKVKMHQTITIGDGEVALHVTEILNNQEIKAKILNNGVISYVKSFNINYYITEEELLKNYSAILDKTDSVKAEYVAISYINKTTNKKIKELIKTKNPDIGIIIKIEKQITDEEYKEICLDGGYIMIMLDRGELGVNMPYEKVGIFQKKLTQIAKQYKKPIIVSTQILESTVNNLTPNRSEIADLTNIVLDGANGIMLCHETAVGKRPAYSIATAKKIIAESEKYRQNTQI